MRDLGKPEVLQSAIVAALISSLASYPRLALWTERRYGLWYLETMLFLCSIVLWAFVFAWHAKYTHRPVFVRRPGAVPLAVAILSALGAAVISHFWLDPRLRTVVPLEYPQDLTQWVALVLWTLAFTQLCLVFAPFAWLMRLFRSVAMAAALTALFAAFVMVIKNHSSPTAMPAGLFAEVMVLRVGSALLAVYLLMRGGLPLVWLWALLYLSRHLLMLSEAG